MKKALWISVLMLSFLMGTAQNMNEVWSAFEQSDRALAREKLKQALNTPEAKVDAAMTTILLNSFEFRSGNLDLMRGVFSEMKDPSPYLYALWFDKAVTGGYGKLDKEHLSFVKTLMASTQVNGSMKASANYVLGVHSQSVNDMKSALKYWDAAGSIKEWQFVGPFDNSSGSGFGKQFEPLHRADPEATFTSKNNYSIKWFTPGCIQNDSWISSRFHVIEKEAVVFAQTFVEATEPCEIWIALGGAGSLKCWVNDSLVLWQEEEWVTELDLYKYKLTLPQGVNRILIQLGFTNKTSYPNFIVRLLNDKLEPATGLIFSDVYRPYQPSANTKFVGTEPHFAETYFLERMKSEPQNVLNYLLLAKMYKRNQRSDEAIEVLQKALAFAPNNILVHWELVENYNEIGNRTELSKEIELLRDLDENSPIIHAFDFNLNMESEKYDDASENLSKLEPVVDDRESMMSFKIRLAVAKADYQEALKLIDLAYAEFPDNEEFTLYKASITKSRTNAVKAVVVLESYLKVQEGARVMNQLLEEYKNLGDLAKLEKLLIKNFEKEPFSSAQINEIVSFYYNRERFKEALLYVDKSISNAPYCSDFWLNRSYVHDGLNMKDEEIADLMNAIRFNPNQFTARERLRELQGKKTILSYLRRDDAYETINSALKSTNESDDNYEVIINDDNYIFFPEGASVTYSVLAVRPLNDNGVERWNDVYIPYNSYFQYLVVEKAEVVKKNGSRLLAEQNDNQMVFPSLEVGDAIYIEYRIENYTSGQLRKELWGVQTFNDFYPVKEATYRILIPDSLHLDLVTVNTQLTPQESRIEEFKCLTWKQEDPAKVKDESNMPVLSEVGNTVYFSSVDNWRTIASWYHDLAMPLAREDYYVNRVYDEIFAGKSFGTDIEKAEAIYEYMCENITYSSVSFRQSNFVPQKPMVTLSTQLGDCKDLSLLFYTLAKKAGLSTNLVLVNTREKNGEDALKLPSVDFDHCIIRINLPEGMFYQELTDAKLPFGYLPTSVENSQGLVIPVNHNDVCPDSLIRVFGKAGLTSGYTRTTSVKVQDADLKIHTELMTEGTVSSAFRDFFAGMTKDRTEEELEGLLMTPFKHNISISDYQLGKTDGRSKSFSLKADFKAEDELLSMGGMTSLKVPFFEKTFTLNHFPDQKRDHPFLYWMYEMCDYYRDEITIDIPADKKFVEVPEDLAVKTAYIDYSLRFEKVSETSIKVIRSVQINRISIPAAEYEDLRSWVRKIVKAEDGNLAFK